MSDLPRIVVVGASAGGIPTLTALVAELPADIPAAVFIVMHIPDYEPSYLAEILARAGPLPVSTALDGEAIQAGHVYVAKAGHHLLIERGCLGVKRGPKENRFRPSIDALFRSAAYIYRERVIGIVLSGMLSDGTSGLWTVKELGGITIVQDPDEAQFDSMPASALGEVQVDHVVPVLGMGTLVAALSREVIAEQRPIAGALLERLEMEVDVAGANDGFDRGIMAFGQRTAFTCPECHGALSKFEEGGVVRYRCHTGHAFTANALLAGITDSVEQSLWSAGRALEEGVMLLDHMATRFTNLGRLEEAERFHQRTEETRVKARVLHDHATNSEHLSGDNLVRPAPPEIAKHSNPDFDPLGSERLIAPATEAH